MVDESGAPWPYAPVDVDTDEPGVPRWACSEAICQCNPPTGIAAERRPHKIFFHDEMANKLGGARCRIFEDGKLLNLDSPWADDGAAVTVQILKTTRSLRLEWAPAELPKDPPYPFRKIYHLDLAETQSEGVRRRLHNIGFTASGTLEEKIRDFQFAYHKQVTGRPEDVEATLVAYHDGGTLPPLSADAGIKPDLVAAPLPPPAAGGQNTPAAAPGVQPQGSAAPIELLTITVRLASRFLLTSEMFSSTGTDWGAGSESATLAAALKYDIGRMVEELGGTPKADVDAGKTWRWTNRANHTIDGASVTLTVSKDASFSTTDSRTEVTKGGLAVFKLVPMNFANFPLGKPANAFLRIQPPQKQVSTGPAGPDLNTKGLTEDFLFRPFSVAIHFDKKGVLVADSVSIIDPVKPAFAAVFSELPIRATSQGFLIDLDWKPDWMRGHSNSRTSKTRFSDTSATAGTSGAIEPALALHITANQNVWTGTLANFFHTSTLKVSAHYVVDLDGHAVKMVDESEVAWHVNPSVWQARTSVNEFSVGMEIVHTNVRLGANSKASGEDDTRRLRRLPDEQYAAVMRICRALVSKYKIPPSRVIGHADVNYHGGGAIQFRQDPSEIFDWAQLASAGLSLTTSTPYAGSDQTVLAVRNTTTTITRTGSSSSANAAVIAKVKQLLWEIGYAVEDATPVAGATGLTKALQTPTFTGTFDGGLLAAVKAFQLHYFSGQQRRYKAAAPPPEPDSNQQAGPEVGTLDAATLKAIADVWNDRNTRG